jgi:hypothetical protein
MLLKLYQPACVHQIDSDQSSSLSGPKSHAAPEIHVVQLAQIRVRFHGEEAPELHEHVLHCYLHNCPRLTYGVNPPEAT